MNNRNESVTSAAKHNKATKSAFTLIELLTVMAIIVVLAGLVVGAAGIIQNKAARSRAQGEIASLGTAITSYETDNGSVPRNSDTDKLDARTSFDPSAYAAASLVLYKLLSGNYFISQSNTITRWTSGNGEHPDRPKAYYEFKPGQVTVSSTSAIVNGRISDPTLVTNLIDPFGLNYGYSTVYMATLETNAVNNVNTPPSKGFNPTYDLWSTAGYGGSLNRPYPTNMTNADKPNVWIRNWN